MQRIPIRETHTVRDSAHGLNIASHLFLPLFTGNQSFRAAVIQSPGPQPAPARPGSRQPPQVPPKPGSRSREASRERPRDEENDHLETELKNILRGNNKEFEKTNGPGEVHAIMLKNRKPPN